MYLCFSSLILMQPTTENLWITKLATEYPRGKHFVPIKYPPKNYGSTKPSLEKYLDPRNTHEKNFRPTKYPREEISDPWNIHEEKLWAHEIPTRKVSNPWNIHEKKLWTHEIPTRKSFGPTKYLRRHDNAWSTKFSTLVIISLYRNETSLLKCFIYIALAKNYWEIKSG